jgi:2-polyprenyl-3-methyl-5-hydroxy-6-metoxy-1,4-benzoquinol methylase
MSERFFSGSVAEFDENWRALPSSERYHFKSGKPLHQLHYAFQSHWRVFRKVMGSVDGGRVLEVGCGRGSMAGYFAHAGFETHLLDSSPEAIACAERNFAADGLQAHFHVGDALSLPFPDGSFDVVVSIGLLEHFEDIRLPVTEQLRILRPGGVFLGYVVPERPISVQWLGAPINACLRLVHKLSGEPSVNRKKRAIYRNTYRSDDYLSIVREFGAQESGSFGMFPVPLVSHSPKFPFTLLSEKSEARIVKTWERLLKLNPGKDIDSLDPAKDPWSCPEHWGLAYLVYAVR